MNTTGAGYALIAFGSALIGMLTGVIVLFAARGPRHPRRLLAGWAFSLGVVLGINTLVQSGLILYVPHLYRVNSPASYLVAPLAFLYARAALRGECRLQRADAVHFVLPVLNTIELMPFFAQSPAAKRVLLEELVRHPEQITFYTEGVLPPMGHVYVRTILGMAYMAWAGYLIHRHAQHGAVRENRALFSWLRIFTLTLGALFAFALVATSIGDAFVNRFYLSNAAVSLLFVILLLFLYFRPQILYGLRYPAADAPARSGPEGERGAAPEEDAEERAPLLDDEQVAAYRAQIDAYMAQAQPFLTKRLTLSDMADGCGIPRHHLSAVLNSGYGMNFNDFINKHRVDYVVTYMNQAAWQHLTLEAIGEEAGFNSRTTFLLAFKKFTGQTPSEFRQNAEDA